MNRRPVIVVCVLLAGLTLAAFGLVLRNQFVNYDDPEYVTHNSHVRSGLTAENVAYALKTTDMVNWHPLTWLSFQLDVAVYGGVKAWGVHLTNVLLHAANTVLLFLALFRMTGALWRSAFVAALFAVHPLHVESVAWVAERKDVLSTLFWMLTLLAYARYAEEPGFGRYLVVLVAFALGLMAKSMLVTLPCVLLLLDYWPLGRLPVARPTLASGGRKPPVSSEPEQGAYAPCSPWMLIGEKVPLFILAAASSLVTLYAQHKGGAVNTMSAIPVRIANALTYYVGYLGKTLWPVNLAVFYPPPARVSMGEAVGAGLLLALVSFMIWKLARRFPYLVVGWLWYLGTLVPVIGLVQVLGGHGMADRYTYVPLIGLFLMVSWGLADLAEHWQCQRLAGVAAAAVLSCCVVGTVLQVLYWYSSTKLFEHSIEVVEGDVAYKNLGLAYIEANRFAEAAECYHRAFRIKPGPDAQAHNNLGYALYRQKEFDGAVAEYNRALNINADYAGAHHNLGLALEAQGKQAEAIPHYHDAVRLAPGSPGAYLSLARLLANEGKTEEAVGYFRAGFECTPGDLRPGEEFGRELERRGEHDALRCFRRALELTPGPGS